MQGGEHDPSLTDKELWQRLSRKRFLTGTAAGGLGLWLAACGDDGGNGTSTGASGTSSTAKSDATIRLITYINWIGKGELKDFKADSGVTVKQIAANSSDDRLTKIQSDPNAGDFVLADLSFAGRLDGLGLLAELDLSKIPNIELVDDPFRIDLASPDKAKMAPTDFGRSGILYRKDKVTEPLESWADFFALAPKYSGKVSMLDFSDGTLPVALIAAGHSTNTTDEGEVKDAADMLVAIKPHVRAFITADEAKPMLDGSAVMGQVEDWAAAPALKEDKNLAWVDPSDGIHAYVEGWVALKASPHLEEVHRLMNFHLQPKVAANFANTLSIAPIQRDAVKFIDPALRKSPVTNPSPDVLDRIEFKKFVGADQKMYDDAWARFKSA
jgi:spermidine/putrescine transport system substrate-binding protein